MFLKGRLAPEIAEPTSGMVRLRILHRLAIAAYQADTLESACKVVIAALKSQTSEVPFARLYLFNSQQNRIRLVGETGFNGEITNSISGNKLVTFDCSESQLLLEVYADGKRYIDDFEATFGKTPLCACGKRSHSAIISPIHSPLDSRLLGLLLLGVHNHYDSDQEYQEFLSLLSNQISEILIRAESAEIEKDDDLVILQDQSNALAFILDTVPVLISYVDHQQHYRFNNKAYADWFGCPAPELCGKHIQDVVGEAAYTVLRPHLEAALQGKQVTYEQEVTYRGAKTRYIRATYVPQINSQGKVDGFIALVADITDYKQLENELRHSEAQMRESEARFRHMTDTSPLMVWMSGTDKLCDYFNQSWLDFTGREIEQEMGNGWVEGVHPDDFARCLETYVTAFDVRQPFEMEYRLKHFSGEYRWILDIGTPRFTSQGEFLGYIGSCIDVTDRVQVEAQMRQLNDILEQRVRERTTQLEAANRELESFSYSVSHDLRAPLRHISGFVDLLQKRLELSNIDEHSQRYLKIISETTKKAGVLIDDLLAFSRMARVEMRWMSIDMNQLVHEVSQEIAQDAEEQTIYWQIKPLPEVAGDLSMLRQVLRNLLSNAVKYSRSRAIVEVEIGSFSEEKEYVFFVRDNGIGFNMQYSHKLFGIFQRLHSDPELEGTGIGLANVQRIIHRHGGRTWAESVVDRGATFYFSLPKTLDI